MRAVALVMLLGCMMQFQPARAQYWLCYASTGYGANNALTRSVDPDGAEMAAPMWGAGVARSFGDSSTHFRISLEWEHQTWNQPFDYTDYGGGVYENRNGDLAAGLNLIRVSPQVVVPLGRTVNIIFGVDLGYLVQAHMDETAQHRYKGTGGWDHGTFDPGQFGPWSPDDSTYTGTSNLNQFQWSFKLGPEVHVGRGWLVAMSFAVGNTTYVPVNGEPDGLTPMFIRAVVGHRF